MGTENAILAATLAEGHTDHPAGRPEPEVDDLIAFLQKMGAEVERTDPDTIEVEGRRRLRGAEHHVIADRIEAGTFVVAAAVTGGDVTLTARPASTWAPSSTSSPRSACRSPAAATRSRSAARRWAAARTRAADIATAPYPGLATDLQPPTAVLLSQASGTSHVHETIFEDRLEWLAELRRMGAAGRACSTTTTPPIDRARRRLHGAEVEMGDLRAGASLILAALAADGTSLIHGAHHVRRGYENIERKFLDLGAQIEHVSEGAGVTDRMKIGIDLGTANVLVYVKGKGIVIQRAVAWSPSATTTTIVAVGEEAREMIGRTPGNITAIRPMKDGVIADYVITEAMLRYFIKKAGRSFTKPDVMISVPSGVTSVEKRAVRDAALKAGAREAYLIEEPLAAAIGANVPIAARRAT